ncbi:unnamed protein product [Paramecium octaurelia]|uniref:Uncharacterized protein n=1 Tax=Paramecium octaurelia TaxID=43137 RepID=A0A8S1TTZ4_PAROT|nr:unnamed protein product [Paramecium octaurelia]
MSLFSQLHFNVSIKDKLIQLITLLCNITTKDKIYIAKMLELLRQITCTLQTPGSTKFRLMQLHSIHHQTFFFFSKYFEIVELCQIIKKRERDNNNSKQFNEGCQDKKFPKYLARIILTIQFMKLSLIKLMMIHYYQYKIIFYSINYIKQEIEHLNLSKQGKISFKTQNLKKPRRRTLLKT